jgi:hypothetical protein
MLTAAFDAAGDRNTAILTVAGFVSSTKDWSDFTRLWTDRLQREDINYFHAVEAAHFRKQFAKHADRPDKVQWRKKLFYDLMEILRAHTYRHFSCSVVNTTLLENISMENRNEFHLTGYSVAGRICEKKVREYLQRDYRNSNVEVEIVFEDGDAGKGKLQTRLSDPNCIHRVFRPKQDNLSSEGCLEPGFVPLQAADWLAYELSIAARNLEISDSIKPISQQRWPLREFLGMLGEDGVVTLEDAINFDKKIELYKDLRVWWRSFGM